jgi:hypothetical protein
MTKVARYHIKKLVFTPLSLGLIHLASHGVGMCGKVRNPDEETCIGDCSSQADMTAPSHDLVGANNSNILVTITIH